MHWLGLQGQPRRTADYVPRFEALEPLHLHLVLRARRRDADLPLQHDHELGRADRVAPANPWRAHSIEWQVSSPPPLFNFDEIPQIVGGPYEYGVPGARHAVFSEDGATKLEDVPAEAEEVTR